MRLKQLTRRQTEVLRYIEKRIATGVPPSVREIGKRFGISTNGVVCHLRPLVRKGYLEHDEETSRGLRLSAAYRRSRRGLAVVRLEQLTK